MCFCCGFFFRLSWLFPPPHTSLYIESSRARTKAELEPLALQSQREQVARGKGVLPLSCFCLLLSLMLRGLAGEGASSCTRIILKTLSDRARDPLAVRECERGVEMVKDTVMGALWLSLPAPFCPGSWLCQVHQRAARRADLGFSLCSKHLGEVAVIF